MITDSVHYVARTGMKLGLGVEFHPESLSHQTAARHIQSVVDLMKVTTEK